MSIDWTAVAAIGQLAAAGAGFYAVWTSVQTARGAKADAAQARRDAVRPRLHLGDLKYTVSMDFHLIDFAVYNVGLGPAFNLQVELLSTDTGLKDKDPVRTLRLLPSSGPDGVGEMHNLRPVEMPWATPVRFTLPQVVNPRPAVRSGVVRFTWFDRSGFQNSEEHRFEISEDQTGLWLN